MRSKDLSNGLATLASPFSLSHKGREQMSLRQRHIRERSRSTKWITDLFGDVDITSPRGKTLLQRQLIRFAAGWFPPKDDRLLAAEERKARRAILRILYR